MKELGPAGCQKVTCAAYSLAYGRLILGAEE
jgi:hypothetical protein